MKDFRMYIIKSFFFNIDALPKVIQHHEICYLIFDKKEFKKNWVHTVFLHSFTLDLFFQSVQCMAFSINLLDSIHLLIILDDFPNAFPTEFIDQLFIILFGCFSRVQSKQQQKYYSGVEYIPFGFCAVLCRYPYT